MQKLYQLWYVDLKARRRFQVWTILIAFLYGVVCSLGLGRPEGRVTWETMGVVFLLTVAFSAYYCVRREVPKESMQFKFTYVQLGEFVRRNRRVLEGGLVSIMFLLGLYLARRVPNPRVEAAGINIRLERAVSSPNGFDSKTINEITTLFYTATDGRLSISPRIVNTAGKKVLEASRENPDAWPAALAVMAYRSTLNNNVTSGPPSACIKVGSAGGIHAAISDSVLANCTQELDHVRWENVIFENVTVVYRGGPVVLENVQFKNCQFSVDYSLAGQKLAKSLTASNSVTATIPGN